MLYLQATTHAGWVDEVQAHLPEVLVDHAACEKKAASTALTLLFRYPDELALHRPLSELAREELEHFELMLGVCEARGVRYGRLAPSEYAGKLLKAARVDEPDRLVDTLLCCALIEARSCERMKLLAEGLPDAQLADLYGGLLASEARHHRLYTDLAAQIAGHDAARDRLADLAAHEARVIHERSRGVRFHSGPVGASRPAAALG